MPKPAQGVGAVLYGQNAENSELLKNHVSCSHLARTLLVHSIGKHGLGLIGKPVRAQHPAAKRSRCPRRTARQGRPPAPSRQDHARAAQPTHMATKPSSRMLNNKQRCHNEPSQDQQSIQSISSRAPSQHIRKSYRSNSAGNGTYIFACCF